MNTLLEVKNLSLTFENADGGFEAVKKIGFSLKKNEILGIVGESGSGKSVTALSILNLTNAAYSPKSSIVLEGQELIGAPENLMRQIRGFKVGFVFQEPMSSLNPLHKIGAQIGETILLHQNVSKETAKTQAVDLMKKVGLKNPEKRFSAYPYELSGGERQRVMIAMAIANKPDVLILDEPTTALDVTIQKQIIDLILNLKKELGMSVIFISHDLKLVAQIANRIVVMYQGKIVEEGLTNEVFKNPKNPYTKKLISSTNLLKNKEKISKKVVLSVQNLTLKYPLKKSIFGRVLEEISALDGVSLKLCEGETLGIVGESGSGKTTLGQCVAALNKYSGKIDFSFLQNNNELRKFVQVIFQDPYNSLNPRMNVLEIVGEGLKVHQKNLSAAEIEQKVRKMLEKVGLKEASLYKYPHEFSGGERQRIAIARAMILSPKLVVLDEPTSALDVTIQKQIIKLLKDFQKQGKMSYIFISHDMRAIRAMADKIAVMKDGKIVEIGRASQILEHPKKSYTKSLIRASII